MLTINDTKDEEENLISTDDNNNDNPNNNNNNKNVPSSKFSSSPPSLNIGVIITSILRSKYSSVILAYMLCSSVMLIVNKGAVYLFPLPSLLLSLQTGFSAIVIWSAGQAGYLKVDNLEYHKAKAYIFVVCVFIFNIFTNMKALEHSNVETVIVFQTLTSLAIAYGDYKLLNSGLPSPKVILSLSIIVFGALCYVATDSAFLISEYKWVFLYFTAKTSEMLYVKHILETVQMTNWGRSFYNNFLSMFPLFFIALLNGEFSRMFELYDEGSISGSIILVVFLSCFVGIGISISGFMCRDAISATSFSVVGNMNKVFTVFINFLIWDHHTSPAGLASLFICLAGGAYYSKVRN